MALRSILSVAALVLVGVGCQRFTVGEDAQIVCADTAECPANFVCATTIGRCVSTENGDVTAPSLDSVEVFVDDSAAVASDVLRAERRVTWRFATDESDNPLFVEEGFVNPRGVVEGATAADDADRALPVAIRTDGDDFVVALTIEARFGVATLSPAIEAFDEFGNRGAFRLTSVNVDTVAPVLEAVDVDVADTEVVDDGDVFVDVRASDDSALVACVVAYDAGAAAPACDDFGALSRAVALPPNNGEKVVSAVVRDAAGNVAGPLTRTVFRLDGGAVLSQPTLTAPPGQTRVKAGDTVGISVVTSTGATPGAARWLFGANAVDVELALADAGDAFVGSAVVPAGVADGDSLVLEVLAAIGGRSSLAAESRSAALLVDLTPPALTLRAADLAVSDRAVSVDVIVGDATDVVSLEVEGDIESPGSVSFRRSLAVTLQETVERGGDARQVRVVAIDAAGHRSAQQSIDFRVLPDAADGVLTLENAALPGVFGIRTGVDVDIVGVLVDAAASVVAGSAALVYLDDAGRTVCTQSVTVAQIGLELDGTAAARGCTGVAVAPTALFARLDVEFAGAADTRRTLSTDNLYIDDVAPTGVEFVFVPEGIERVGAAATRRTEGVAFAVTGTDAHPLTVALSGAVAQSIAPRPFVSPETLTVDLTDPGGNVDVELFVLGTIADEVGHSVTRVVRVRVDRVDPSAPRAVEAFWSETGALPIEDPTRTTAPNIATLRVTESVVDGADRLIVRDEFGDEMVALTDDFSAPFPLPRALDAFELVAVDDAGNTLSAPLVLVPRVFLRNVPTSPVGPAGVSFVVDSAQAETLNFTAPGNVVVRVNDNDSARAVCTPRVGGPPALNCTIQVQPGQAPEGRHPTGIGAAVLRATFEVPRFTTTAAAPLLVDTTPPVLSAAAIRVDGVADRVIGAAGAVTDSAGADSVGAEFPPALRATFRANNTNATAVGDGSFAIGLAPAQNDTGAEDVVVTATDVAGNVSASVTLQNDTRRPVVTATPRRARVRGGDSIVVDVNVSDASAVNVPVVTVGGVAAAVTGAAPAFVATVTAPNASGSRAVLVDVSDAAGNSATANANVIVDVDAPTLTAERGARTNQNTMGVAVTEVGGGTLARVDAVVLAGVEVFRGQIGGPTGSGTFFTPPLSLPDGATVTTTFTAVDDVGNTATAAFSTVFDVTPPTVNVVVDSSDPNETRVPFTITVSGDVAESGLFCRVDNPRVEFRPCTDPSFGLVGPPARSVAVAPGTHFLGVRAVDLAGNASATVERPFTVVPRQRLAGGDGVFCAVDTSDDSLTCWGDQRGELRSDSQPGPTAPVVIPPPNPGGWREVAVHGGTVCALDNANSGVFCWGNNSDSRALRESPPATNAVQFVALDDGARFASLPGTFRDLVLFDTGGCVIDLSNQLQCWGRDFFGAGTPSPVPNTADFDVVDVSADGRNVCARHSDGSASCFGDNNLGQLLNGGTFAGGGPIGTSEFVIDVDTSGRHTCFLAAADRSAFCGGDDSASAVTGESRGRPDPIARAVELDPVVGASLRVLARGTRTCLLGVDGVLRCQGQLAHGEVADGGRHGLPGSPTDPRPAVSGAVFDDVVGDDATLCGVERGTGAVLCVGESGRGQITLAAATSPGVTLTETFDSLTARGRTVCITNGSTRRCVGDAPLNRWLASGFLRPTSDTFIAPPSSVTDRFAMADDYACGVPTQDFFAVACVGAESAPLAREVFDPEDAQFFPAFTAPLGASAQRIALADDYGCATTSNGLRCWGEIPSGASARLPIAVGANQPIEDVAVGDDHICVRAGGNGLRCLGSNAAGQLGLGAGAPTQRVPDFVTLTQVDPERATSINGGGFGPHGMAAAGNSTCIASGTGPVCWGQNENGIAGRAPTNGPGGPSFAAVLLPRTIDGWPSNQSVSAVAMGRARACAASDGQLLCWGGDVNRAAFNFVERVDDDGGYGDVAVSDDGFVCGLAFNRVRCFGDLSGGVAGDGAGFVEVATEVLP